MSISRLGLFVLMLVGPVCDWHRACQCEAFLLPSRTAATHRAQLSMINRNIADANKSKRKLFQELRELVNSSPEFQAKEMSKPDVELWVKANADGKQVGDCPFAHFIQMVLRYKRIDYLLHPTLSNSKPDWLVNDFEGKMPCLVHKGKTIVESMEIAKYLEETFPERPLTQPQARDWQEVMEITKGFFPTLAKCLKNTDPSKDAELLLEMEAQINMLDDLLRDTPGRFLCGDEVSMADLSLAPKLYHAAVALQHFKNYTFYHPLAEFTRPHLENYMERMFGRRYFKSKGVNYTSETVIWGWKRAIESASA